jgi:hypothetical protein
MLLRGSILLGENDGVDVEQCHATKERVELFVVADGDRITVVSQWIGSHLQFT